MKKILLYLLIVSIAILIAIQACKKDTEKINQDLNTPYDKNTKVESLIKNFLNNTMNNLKTKEEYKTDSAVWYLEATLNYSYAIYDSSSADYSVDSAHFSIKLNNNDKVDSDDLSDTYYKMTDSLKSHYSGITESTKHLMLADVSIVSNQNGVLQLQLVSIIGSGNPVWEYGRFGDEDYWYWGWELGKCDQYIGQGVGSDAQDQLQYKINNPVAVSMYRIYFTDLDSTGLIYPGEYPDPNNQYGEFRLFLADGSLPGPTEEPCLCPDELNYYLYDGIDYIIDDRQPQGKEFSSCIVYEDIYISSQYWGRLHVINITYGIKHQTIDPPSPL
ncbi:MAG: hypothetical protein KAT33_05865 [Bacteroidales bacterium]|nr:hypothetical protein [Bacteroidales bacterium]MCK4638927.1 hypothetical protein [Bacteroidales bacterium]